jgi:hypothetical protein
MRSDPSCQYIYIKSLGTLSTLGFLEDLNAIIHTSVCQDTVKRNLNLEDYFLIGHYSMDNCLNQKEKYLIKFISHHNLIMLIGILCDKARQNFPDSSKLESTTIDYLTNKPFSCVLLCLS